MKRIMSLLALLLALVLLCSGCDSHKGKVQVAGVWVDEAEMKKYNFDFNLEKYEAESKGDTYCKNCRKINPGKVRICKYCGKYVLIE